MPRINRVRVANIKYDHNKKQMPDLTFNLHDQDTVFLLANGGGKSLLVQLILQTVLPNRKMGKRWVADLFESTSYTGHVAVEWSLDAGGEADQFLCTGFCFQEGRGGQRLDYYNYLIDYTEEDDFSIAELPLIKNQDLFQKRQPIKYQELRDWLQEQENQRVEVFDKNYAYQNRLRQFRILPAEWESIARINAAEGGVDDFFARSKTTNQLLNNLLVPQIKEVLFAADDEDELFAAFSQHRTKLLRMPKIEANIKHFSVISEQAEEVMKEVEKLAASQEEFADQKLDLACLQKRFQANAQAAARKLEQLRAKQDERREDKRKLEWKRDSHQVFEQQLKYKQAAAEKEEEAAELERREEKLARLEQKQEELTGLKLYNQAQTAQEKVEKYRYKLEILNDKTPELKEKLQQVKQKLRAAWQQKQEELSSQEEATKDKLSELKADRMTQEQKLKNQQAEKEDLISRRSSLQSWLDEFEQTRKKLKVDLDLDSLTKPQEVAANWQDKLEAAEQEKQQAEKKISQLEAKQEDLREEKLELNQRQTELEAEEKNIQEKLTEFENKREEIAALLAQESKYWTNLLAEKEQVVAFSREELQAVRAEKVNREAEVSNLEEKLALAADRDYYVPHNLLLKVQRKLEARNVYTVLGSQWLAEQDIAEAKKEEYLHQQPLLPYSILLESGQVGAAQRVLKNCDLEPDFPLVLLFRESLAAVDEGAKERLADDLFIYQPQSNQIFTSQESFEQFKDNLEAEIAAKEEEVDRLIEREEFFLQLRSRITDFYDRYSADQIEEWQQNVQKFAAEQEQLAERIKELASEQSAVKQSLEEQRTRIENQQEQIYQLRRQVDRLEQFQDQFAAKQKKQGQLTEVEEKLTAVREQINKLAETKEELTDQIMTAKQDLQELYRRQNEHQAEYRQYDLEEVTAAEEVELPYSRLQNQYRELNQQLNQKQGQRREIEELISTHQSSYEEKCSRIEELTLDWEWLKENQRAVAPQEIKEVQEACRQQQKEAAEQQELVAKADKRLQKMAGRWETLEEKVKTEFDRAPYLDFSPANHQSQLAEIKEQLAEAETDLEQIAAEIDRVEDRQQANQTAAEDLEYEVGSWLAETVEEVEPLAEQRWQELDLKPKQALRKWKEEFAALKTDLEQQKRQVKKEFQDYVARLRRSDNPQVRQFIKNIEQIMQEGKIYNYDYIESRFLNMLEAFTEYKKNYQRELKENERNLEHLTNLSFRRAKTVYESIVELPRSSRVRLYGRSFQVIKIDWEAVLGDQGKEKIYNYLQQVLDDLQELKEEGLTDDELDKKMEERLKIKNLINVIAPIEECRIRVLKPRSREVMEQNQLDYFDWSEVARWSGGESYSIYMTMFMILVSYIRQQLEGRSSVWKTVIADNPFGKASSGHILDTVFEIAEANQIQLFCLTAHRQENILFRFPVAYSLQLRTVYGKEVMKHDRLESGFYDLSQVEEG